jgi:hypothetical protein
MGMKMNRIGTMILSVVVPALTVQSAMQASAAPAKFGSKWQALIGEWKGENASGGSAGACGFHLDLADHIIVRTNHAVLAPTGGDAAKAHDDLMIIYPGSLEDKGKAVYFDNEGHVIEYDAEWSADGNTLTFLSKPAAGPQFRLTYKREDAKTFSVIFAMAAPGQGSFKVYTSGKIKQE